MPTSKPAIGLLACMLAGSGCVRDSTTATNVSPSRSSSASEAQPDDSTREVSPHQDHPDVDGSATVAPPTSSPQAAVDEKGCVRNLVSHAAGVALEMASKPMAEALGRAPQPSDLTDPRCASVGAATDLDADGASDHDVSLCLPPGGHVWDHYLYFSNKGCARFADHLVAAELTPLAESHGGVKDLETVAANGCAGNDFTWTKWRWDGSGYRVADTATCTLCDDSWAQKPGPKANSHPYCKAEIVRRKAQKP